MKNMARWVYGLLAVAVMLLFATGLVACQAYGTNPAPTPAATPTSPPAASAPVAVTVVKFAFSPASITVKVGTTVTWTNQDAAPHTVTSDTGVFDSGNFGTNATYRYTFSQAGTFPYYCAVHPNMKATVVVVP